MNGNPYEILGVPLEADQEVIKKAYRKLAMEFHPDRNPGDHQAEERFKDITQAYGILSDPRKREAFDRTGSADGMPDGADFFSGFGLDDALRAFQDMFGFSQSGRRSASGADLIMDIELELGEAGLGASKEISFDRKERCGVCGGTGADPDEGMKECRDCNGQGRIASYRRTLLGTFQTVSDCPSCGGRGKIPKKPCASCNGMRLESARRRVSVEIPGGISVGHYIKVRGMGHFPPDDGPPGDLIIRVTGIHYGPFTRDGDDLAFRTGLSFPEAALGTKIRIPTVEGEDLEIEIPAGTQPLEPLVLKRRGMKHLRRMGRGNLIVIPEVYVPEKLSRAERKVLEGLLESERFRKP
jgi:molecular chaperone DnaJ